MTIEIKVPMLPESVADAKVVTWRKNPGEFVKRDEPVVDLETDKVVLEVPAPADAILMTILKPVDAVVQANEPLAQLQAATAPVTESTETTAKAATSTAPVTSTVVANESTAPAGPAARRIAAQHGIALDQLAGSGKEGRITPEDILGQIEKKAVSRVSVTDEQLEKRVPMSRLRIRIAERLLAAQHNSAILTTFNEVNLQKVMALRARYKESFEKKYAVRLGLMSFFTKAVVEALKGYPAVNASIDGNDIVYHNYFDIGIAVSSERGLVVPIVRSADRLSFAELEQAIADYGRKARASQITLEEMTGGTFTISNGGVFGSLLATPITNPPQSAILGMNKIEERPIVENCQVVIRPMMYLALSYDHRIIDGKESIGFLVAIKEFLEDPARLLLAI